MDKLIRVQHIQYILAEFRLGKKGHKLRSVHQRPEVAGAELQADSRGIDPCSRMTGLANLAGSLVKQNTFVSRSTAGYGEPEQ